MFDKNAKLLNGDKAVFSTNCDGTTGLHMQKSKPSPKSHTLYK